MRVSIDVGGTFTDLVLDFGDGALKMFKAQTTNPDPLDGIFDAIERASEHEGINVKDLLSKTELLFHSTTRAINAVITRKTANTALLATKGHPDSLVIREGGRLDPFNYRVPYPDPYIPRALTYEVPGRIWADGRELEPLNEDSVHSIINDLKTEKVEAVAVALLWSFVNPAHERRIGELLDEHLPDVPFTLSHELNPTIREYRRCSSCAIDASLKPIMSNYLRSLKERLEARGLKGQIFAVTSQGGFVDLEQLAERPILALNSGPSMAPVSGKFYAELEGVEMAIITDAGGTTYDVSLVRDGVIPWSRDTWIGQPYQGDLTGFASVDVKSIGAGGGSIASVNSSGLLSVGPNSAGSIPGPVCYSRGGTQPTVTDAALMLGYIDPAYFLGGDMLLAHEVTHEALEKNVATPLGLSVDAASLAILDLATEQMVNAIEDITVKQGIDPEDTVIIAGGGASGLNTVQIAKRLRCARVIVPDVGATLSAAGAMMSDMTFEFVKTEMMNTTNFDRVRAEAAIDLLTSQAEAFFDRADGNQSNNSINFSFEGRYPGQVWEIDVPLKYTRFSSSNTVKKLVDDFHARHKELFSFRDDGDAVEIMSFRALARCQVSNKSKIYLARNDKVVTSETKRPMVFPGVGAVDAIAYRLEVLESDAIVEGPAVIESSFTTIVLPPGSHARKRPAGHIVITVDG